MASDYAEKLKDPRWQRKRLEIFTRDKWTCCECGDSKSELQLHHKRYIKGREPWEYADHCFKTLCVNCHKGEHGLDRPKDVHIKAPNDMGLMSFLDGGKNAHLLLPGEREQVYARWNECLVIEARAKAERARAREMGLY